MSDSSSRYANCKNLSFQAENGKEIIYKERRFIPKTSSVDLGRIIIQPYERLDNIAAQTIGDPLQYWRICDSKVIFYPLEITEKNEIR